MSTVGVSANKLEMLQRARAAADELGIELEIVLRAIEMAYEKAARTQFGAELDTRAVIDRKTGEVAVARVITVVDPEDYENESAQMMPSDARKLEPTAEVGTEFHEELPPVDFSRVATQSGKQIILQNLREAQRERQFNDFKDRVGEIINGIVKRVEYGNIVVDLGRAEGVVRRNESIPRESFENGDRVRAYIMDVRRELRGPQIFLSRAHPQFMVELFKQEVPEVYEGIIQIPRVARDPGSRAKIAVTSSDSSIDPVGACVGMRGSRVQAVVSELAGEKIDIIPFREDAATFIVNALQPAEVAKVVLDEDESRVEVVVPDDHLSLAIGRRGQNVRLASQLSGWAIDIVTEAEESERRQKEFAERTEIFMNALDVDEVVAQLLVTEDFEAIEEVAYVEHDELASIEGFGDELAGELQSRAREHLERVAAEMDAKRVASGVEDAVLEVEGVTLEMAVRFGEKEVKTVDDLAGLTADDLRGWFETRDGERVREEGVLEGFDMDVDTANELILRARLAAGWITQEDFDLATKPEVEEEEMEELDPEAAAIRDALAAVGSAEEADAPDAPDAPEAPDLSGDEPAGDDTPAST